MQTTFFAWSLAVAITAGALAPMTARADSYAAPAAGTAVHAADAPKAVKPHCFRAHKRNHRVCRVR
jgi:hypothetical protein